MRFRPQEEYQMVDMQSSPERISSQTSIDNDNETASSPDVFDIDSDHELSIVFEELEMCNNKDDQEVRDFNDDTNFQSILSNYKLNRMLGKYGGCFILAVVGFAVWLILLIVYANLSVNSLSSGLRWQTDIQLGGENITLNPYKPENKNLTMDAIRNGKLYGQFQSITWLNKPQYPEKGTGYYLTRGYKGKFIIKLYNSEDEDILIDDIQFSYQNNFFYIEDLILNPGKSFDDVNAYHIVTTDVLKQWRHLSFAIYWLYKPVTKEFIPIQEAKPKLDNFKPTSLTKLHFVKFSPDGTKLLFGAHHDLFIQDLSSLEVTRVTDTGSDDIFNGKADWVYEEEILSDDTMVWWAPDGKNIVYGTIDEAGVLKYEIDYYVKDKSEIGMNYNFEDSDSTVDDVHQYPIKKQIHYPKPGTKVPKLELYKYNLENKKRETLAYDKKFDEFILYDASWINSDNFLIKITDRTSSIQSKQVLTVSKNEHKEIESVNAPKEFGGWIDKFSSITKVNDGYVDKIIVNNRTHLAYYEEPLSRTPKLLTSSPDWDVIDSAPVVYNPNEKLVYTLSNINGSMDSHLIAVTLDCKLELVLGGYKEGKYAFSSDDRAQFIALEYLGPDLAWQKVIDTGDLHVHDDINQYLSSVPLKSNLKEFKAESLKYNMPTTIFKSVKHNNIDINVKEILPPNFDPSNRKYPVLVNAYGGPGSQTVTKSFTLGFEESISASLDAIVLQIDPRGTDGKGWQFKSYGNENIGHWEAKDIITITSEYIKKNKKIINKDAVAIWGWSYGGFTTLKTLELDKGETFKFGMAVAPVTNFLFYNAFYTERYMNLPLDNPKYTTDSLVRDIDSFKSLNRLLIMHGTADDNVHFQNLLWLLDKFNSHSVENYDVHFFTDNDHGIHYNNADVIVFDKLHNWLQDAFMGKFKDFV